MDINKYFNWVNRSNDELKEAQEEIFRLKSEVVRAQHFAADKMYECYDAVKAAKIEGMKLALNIVIRSTCNIWKSNHAICEECATKAVQAEIDKLI